MTDAISYSISADYLQLFEDTTIPVETMENMFIAMREDYSVEAAKFLSAVYKEESRRILLEALKSGVSLTELQKIYRKKMLKQKKITYLYEIFDVMFKIPKSDKKNSKIVYFCCLICKNDNAKLKSYYGYKYRRMEYVLYSDMVIEWDFVII